MDGDITSGFGTPTNRIGGQIDFSRMVRVERGGSTCDTFIARMHGKSVFVKRVKAGLKFSPVVRAAFAKEFEIGFRLRHQALPTYCDVGDDYIVMEYVDGDTLSEMIKAHDEWLSDPGHIREMFRQLVDAVGYLHSNNVVHSDIKPDNVMITRGTRNLMLIDLDKAYTFTRPDTPGDPAKYGLAENDHGNPAIDFRGIARIVDSLEHAGYPTRPLRCFRRKLDEPDITADKLLDALKPRRRSLYAFIIACIAAAIALIFTLTPKTPMVEEADVDEESVAEEIITPDSADTSAPGTEPTKSAPRATASDNLETIINRGLAEHFGPVDKQISQAETLLQSGTASDNELREANYAVNRSVSIAMQTAYTLYEGRFPQEDAIKVQLAVANSPACRRILDRQSSLSKRIAAEIMRRHPSSYTASDSSYLAQ